MLIRSFSLSACFLLFASALAADWASGVAAFKSGDLATARQEFTTIVEENPDWHGGHLMLGQTLLRQGQSKAALKNLETAHGLAPDDVTTRLALAKAAVLEKQWQHAEAALRDLAESSVAAGQKADFFRLQGQAARGLGDLPQAIASLREASELRPKDAKLHYQVATAAFAEERHDLALDHLRQGRQLAPDHLGTSKLLTQLLFLEAEQAEADERQAGCVAAASEAQHLLQLKSTPAHFLLAGRIDLCAGNLERAESLLARASEGDAGDREFYYLARSQALQKKWSQAEASLAVHLEGGLEGSDLEKSHRLMGFIQESQHRFDSAIEHYETAGDAELVARAQRSREILRQQQEAEELETQIADLVAAQKELEAAEARLKSGGL